LATALRVWQDGEGVRDGTDEILTIRPPVHRVNAELRTSFVGHHVSATFEHSSTLINVMADATEYRNRNQRRKCIAFRAQSALSTQRTARSQRARRSLTVSLPVCDTGTGA
jgi:hypothetical protein